MIFRRANKADVCDMNIQWLEDLHKRLGILIDFYEIS